MDARLQRYERYAGVVKRLALLAALWPARARSTFFRFVVAVEAAVSIFTAYGIVYLMTSLVGDFAKLTSILGIAMGFGTMLTKVTTFWIYRDRLIEMHETLEKHFLTDLQNINYRPALLSLINYFYLPTILLSCSSFCVVFSFNVVPFIMVLTQRMREGNVVQYHTPFPSKYPAPESTVFFGICYALQLVASYALTTVTMCTDALWGYYVFQMAGQLRVLSYRMQNLTSSDNHTSVVKECVVRRRILARCRDHLQTIYGPVILWMLTGSALNTCANIFHITQIDADHIFLSLPIIFYLFMKFMQVLLYGWCGLLLISESEILHEAIYDSGWPGCGDKLFMSNIRMMLMCKPLILKACQFYPITLDMVTAIINTALSYFFLLRTLDSD